MATGKAGNFDAVVFDLDGTLIDSMPFHAQAWLEAFSRQFDISVPSEEPYIREGEKDVEFGRYIFEKYTGSPPSPESLAKVTAAYHSFLKTMYRVEFFPGALELVKDLSNDGYALALVSGSQDVLQLLAPHPDFTNQFKAIVSGKDTPVGKPRPEPFLKAFEKLGIPATRSLVIENAFFGIRAARNAGASCWAIRNNSPLSADALLAEGAEKVFENLAKLQSAFFPVS